MRDHANITLIGMPGAGKSTLGRRLAAKLGYQFVDSDRILEGSGLGLQEIIDQEGEEEFLRREQQALLALGGSKQVFAPGGSCVLLPRAMEHLRRISLVVFLQVPLEVLDDRLRAAGLDGRGIIGLRSLGLAGVFRHRLPLYRRYAHLEVDLGGKGIKEGEQELYQRLRQYQGCRR